MAWAPDQPATEIASGRDREACSYDTIVGAYDLISYNNLRSADLRGTTLTDILTDILIALDADFQLVDSDRVLYEPSFGTVFTP